MEGRLAAGFPVTAKFSEKEHLGVKGELAVVTDAIADPPVIAGTFVTGFAG